MLLFFVRGMPYVVLEIDLSNDFLISQSLIALQQIDDAAIGKTVFHDVVLHNLVVTMGVYADIRVIRKAEIHDAARRVAFSPLVHIARLPHNPFCSIHICQVPLSPGSLILL
jgi:hypothetical protein